MAAGEEEHLVAMSQIAAARHTPFADHDRASNESVSFSEHEALPLSMTTLCRQFLENVKHHFGEPSQESSIVHRALYEFGEGSISKRETISMMNGAIRDHGDLKRDLMAVFDHRDARWSPGDFDFFGVPNLKQDEPLPGPSFLQPPYQSTFTLPPVFSHSSDIARTGFTINPRSYIRQAQQQDDPSGTEYTGVHKPCESLEMQRSPYNGNVFIPSPRTFLEHARSSTFAGDSLDIAPNRRSDQSSLENNSSLHNRQPEVSLALPQASSDHTRVGHQHPVEYNDASQSMLHQPHTLQVEQTSIQPFQSVNGHNAGSGTDTAFDNIAMADQVSSDSIRGLSDTSAHARRKPNLTGMASYQTGEVMPSTPGMPSQGTAASVADVTFSRSVPIVCIGTFIHALCGKSFSSRSKVKKHHWGNSLNDLNTTTGCWAKHRKPRNVEWDDDPSCKAAAPRARSTKQKSVSAKPRQGSVRIEPFEQKAPIAPSMVTRPSPSDSRTSTNPCTPALVPSPSILFQMGEHSDETPRAYHSHRLPSFGSMDRMMAVANSEVPTIKAPKPQGRNDLILSNLNDQAQVGNWDALMHHTVDWIMPPRASTPGAMNDQRYASLSHDSNTDIQEPFFSLSSPSARPLLAHKAQISQHDSNCSMPPDFFNGTLEA